MNSFLCLCLIVLATTANAGKNRPSGSGSSSAATTTTTEAATDGTSGTSGSDGIYGATIAALTSRDSVETSSNCGDDATGYYEEYVTSDARYIIVSGAPAHDAEYDQEHANPNTRCERWQYVKLPLTWTDSGSTTQQMGATGYVTSGTTTFDARSSPTGELAAYYEWDSLDPYYGHSDADMQYHYHAVPNGWSSANDPDACEHIGYMHDGGKLYGFCGDLDSCYVQNSSSDPTTESDYTYTNDADCQLDECNMYNMDGEMVYVMTPSWPYVPNCMKGDVQTAYGFTP
jgi:hypothetical protein